ncbi:hypothetical protein ABEB36_012737 [Hypothenemus hampei]|uniref:Uncharacterized protein n=1 Tax=Hypothenemus hampei TaxID=57062 RepID=A0ABD1ECB1_HYPHA
MRSAIVFNLTKGAICRNLQTVGFRDKNVVYGVFLEPQKFDSEVRSGLGAVLISVEVCSCQKFRNFGNNSESVNLNVPVTISQKK